jgi:hypothetical protein
MGPTVAPTGLGERLLQVRGRPDAVCSAIGREQLCAAHLAADGLCNRVQVATGLHALQLSTISFTRCSVSWLTLLVVNDSRIVGSTSASSAGLRRLYAGHDSDGQLVLADLHHGRNFTCSQAGKIVIEFGTDANSGTGAPRPAFST